MKSLALIKKYGWHEFLAKTNFSFLVGSSHPSELLNKVEQESYSSIAINDFDGVYGLARSHLFHKKNALNTKLLYGAEIHLEADHHKSILEQVSLCLLVRSKAGYLQLNQILSFMHKEKKQNSFISLEDLKQFPTDQLLAIQPMRGGLYKENVSEHLLQIKSIFSDFYIALTKTLHPLEDQYLPLTYELSKKLEIPCIISQDIFFHHPSQKPINDVQHAIRHNLPLWSCEEQFFPNAERYPHSLPNLIKIYSQEVFFEESLKNAYHISQKISFSFDELSYHYPKEMIPAQHSPQSFLEELVWSAFHKKYPRSPPEKVRNTLKHELAIIYELNFADYFLSVWDIVAWARSQNILCQGRGSAANSVVCHMLGITAIDPLQFDLLFERFISKERGDPPDIDVDFEHERREEVIQYIYRRYGRARAAMVANVICFKKKGAMRAAGKALGIDEKYLTTASKVQRTKFFRSKNTEELLQSIQDIDSSPQGLEKHTWKLWQEISERLIGFPRHLGIHSGGFIISQENLNQLVAQEPATMLGRSVIQWCKEDIEGLGFFKIDILALGMLSALRKSFALVNSTYQKDLDLYSLPPSDPKTYQMIQEADTVGVFQIESRAQMSMLPRLKPKNFYDLVIEIAIIRPGPIQGGVIHPYLKRRNGQERVIYPDERLKPILEKTLGIAIFQEQAMRIAIAVGDFTPGEADELRRNIGSWSFISNDSQLNPLLEKLRRGMEKNKIAPHFIDQICGQMKGFAEYGFPESHSISFAFLAYASSYLKRHYPAEFFTALLNSQPMGFYSPHALLQTAKRQGVSLLPLSINHSQWEYQSNYCKDHKTNSIRMGFLAIRSLSRQAIEKIVLEREQRGAFLSIQNFLDRCPIYREDFLLLAASSSFEDLSLSRKDAIWLAEAIPQKPFLDLEESKVSWKQNSRLEDIQQDFSSFQTSLSLHPTKVYQEDQWRFPVSLKKIVSSKDFSKLLPNQVFYSFGMLVVKQAPPTAKGMVFLTLEDEYGFINLAVSPQVYRKYYPLIEGQSFLCVYGKMQKSGAGHSIWVKSFVSEKESLEILPLHSQKTKTRDPQLEETKLWIQQYLHKKLSRFLPARSYF